MEILLHCGALKHRHPFPNASVMSTNPTGYNDTKYEENLSAKTNYVVIPRGGGTF